MTLCSVFGCASNNDRKRKTVDNDNNLHFYTFPKRDKSPLRHRKWEHFCKRKNFKPSAGSVICSKHFIPLDFNQSDVLKKQLMPESKCIVRLNPDAVPSIQTGISNSKKSVNPRQESLHIMKKRQIEIIDDLIKTSTPKKKMVTKSSFFEEIDDVSTIEEPDVNNKIQKTSEIGIQCELGNENLIRIINYEKKNDLSFEIESESEDSENTSDDETSESQNNYNTCKSKNVKSSINFNKDECFIVFWECLSKLFNNCNVCGSKILSLNNFIQGSCLCVTTVCEKNHTFQWYSQKKIKKKSNW
ncbi:unnamed protein product [Macrosiphum euphorbiae]|uniref:THAP-type domain-containing protein n=1 Tax=Macrosiphum euphorbiae TaxID=13131 RepID=A0AAV0W622_9HEMI|nr:unnamed protein product [Macrosiphum euphorbiae]